MRCGSALLLWLLLCLPVSQAIDLPDMGDTSESVLSLAEENRLGAAFMRNLRGALSIVNDPEVESYINALGERLTSHSGSQQRFTFFVINDTAINAFAGPGGYIGINSGLIMTTETESELASVVAHEISHVTQRHLARAFESAKQSSLPTAAAIIAAIILASQDSQLGSAAIATALASSTQSRLNFTRHNEQEADRLGMALLASSDFDPQGMPTFFERLYRNNRGSESQSIEFLRTHPLSLSRVSDTRNRAEQYPVPAKRDQTNYLLIRTKLQVLSDGDGEKSIIHFKQQLENGSAQQQNIARYGYALSLAKTGKHDQAMKQMQTLMALDPDRIVYQIAAANIAYSAGDLEHAAMICEEKLKIYPHHHAFSSLYSAILIKQKKSTKASALLYEHLRRRPANPRLYQLLAQAEYLNNNQSASHEALAEYYYLTGLTHNGIEQLVIALDLLKETKPSTTARIKFRKEQMEEEVEEQKKNH